MSPGNEAGTIIVLGFGSYDTLDMGANSLSNVLRQTCDRYKLEANVEHAVSRYGAKDLLDNYAKPTAREIRVNTGETENPVTGGDPRPFVLWPQYKGGDVRIFVCSNITREDTFQCNPISDGDLFAREIIVGIPRIVTHYQDERFSKTGMLATDYLEWDYENHVFHLPRDLRSERSIQNSVAAMDQLVKGLWENGLDFPCGTYLDIATKANVNILT